MAEISRATLFRKLSPQAFKALESAHAFCRLRENPYVELSHWLHQILGGSENDLQNLMDALRVDRGEVQEELESALSKLPRGSTSVVDFSAHLEELVERAFVYAELLFGSRQVGTGHILVSLLKTPNLSGVARKTSPTLAALNVDVVVNRLLSTGSVETEVAPEAEDGTAPESAPKPAGEGNALDKFCRDMTAEAASGQLDRIVGRDAEIRQLIDILLRRRQNNPILTGEAGVGKTAVVEGLAGRLADGDVPDALQGVRLLALDVGALQAGASLKGEFEKRLKQVIEDAQSSTQPIIMFIDEAHTLIGAGGSEGTGDAANLLKPALARGELRTVAATTWAEYKKHIEKDPALTRRFQVVKVDEPDDDNALAMMRAVSGMLESHHDVRILDEALEASVVLSRRYIADRQLPDKSVSLLDTTCARVALSQSSIPARLEASRRRLASLERESEILSREQELGTAHKARLSELAREIKAETKREAELAKQWEKEDAAVRDLLELESQVIAPVDVEDEDAPTEADRKKLRSQLKSARKALAKIQDESALVLPVVDANAVARVVGDWTGIPVGDMVEDEIAGVLDLTDRLKERVVGQDQALEVIAKRVQTSRAGLSDPQKPVGVFMLCGPSGVGKTETALALAEALYGGEQNIITLNMSEFQEKHTVSTLKGAPPGYVGYGEGGKLTEAVRRKPYSVVLLDEVEKAHPDVHEVFFQVFDKGVMEDGEGRSIDFKNTLIILTSNVGTEELDAIGEAREGEDPPELADVQTKLRPALLGTFPPALLGRMIVVPYYPLSDEVFRRLIRSRLGKIAERAQRSFNAGVEFSDDAVELILSRCTERESGGRVIDAILTNTLLPKLSTEFLTAKLEGRNVSGVEILVKNNDFVYSFAA